MRMKITKASAAEIASKLSPAAKKLLIAVFVQTPPATVKVQADQFMALIELMAKRVLRADMSWDDEPVTVLERGGRFVVDVLKAEPARELSLADDPPPDDHASFKYLEWCQRHPGGPPK